MSYFRLLVSYELYARVHDVWCVLYALVQNAAPLSSSTPRNLGFRPNCLANFLRNKLVRTSHTMRFMRSLLTFSFYVLSKWECAFNWLLPYYVCVYVLGPKIKWSGTKYQFRLSMIFFSPSKSKDVGSFVFMLKRNKLEILLTTFEMVVNAFVLQSSIHSIIIVRWDERRAAIVAWVQLKFSVHHIQPILCSLSDCTQFEYIWFEFH